MASSISLASPILLLILFHLLLETDHTCFASNPTGKKPNSLRLTLTWAALSKNLPKDQYAPSSRSKVKGAIHRPSVKSPVKASGDVYVTTLSIGTPPVTFSAIVDTGSDLIWTKCQSSPFYDSSKSKSFSELVPCGSFLDDCNQSYADGSSLKVSMGREMFTIGGMDRNLTFGCGTPNDKTSFKNYGGIVGMGRGKLSLVSQLNISVFSYCMASRYHKSDQSILLIEDEAKTAIANKMIQTTPLLPQGNPSNYYISLEGISVGETKLAVSKSDFEIVNGKGGMIIDSGTTFTYLDKGIIDMIENEFMKQTKLKKLHVDVGDTLYNNLTRCFDPSYDVKIIPKLVFHFSGANWDVPRENYIYTKKGQACLAFMDNDNNDAQKVSIFGNMQQQNTMVLYDLHKNSLSFIPAKCNQL
ncbi:hypothetical protein L2E82_18054 [Cichorium intybus]|uniref:Uncharacterized protein n=1 Tax=Cichorium intybus TaxID=13427 RepID=A0ACB9F979_CICIN|nr:hypothetical protein L2E82_18054 [Cichorium intybus]